MELDQAKMEISTLEYKLSNSFSTEHAAYKGPADVSNGGDAQLQACLNLSLNPDPAYSLDPCIRPCPLLAPVVALPSLPHSPSCSLPFDSFSLLLQRPSRVPHLSRLTHYVFDSNLQTPSCPLAQNT